MFSACDTISFWHEIFLSTYLISDQSKKTYIVFLFMQKKLMFKINWNVLLVFLRYMTWAVEQWKVVAMRNNFENVLEYESRQRTRFEDNASPQYVRDTLSYL